MRSICLRIFAILCVLLSVSEAHAGEFWTKCGPIETGSVWNFHRSHDGAVFVATDAGIYQSDDSGQSWTNIGLETLKCRKLFACNRDTVLAYVSLPLNSRGLYRTTNSGRTWQQSFPRTDYIQTFNVDTDGSVVVLSGGGLFRTSDCGTNWDSLPVPFDPLRMQWFNIADHGSYLLSVDKDNSFDYEIFRSNDKGITWERLGVVPEAVDGFFQQESESTLFATIRFAGLVFWNEDDGSWHNTDLDRDDILELEFTNEHTIYALTYYNHIYESTDSGVTWLDLGPILPEPDWWSQETFDLHIPENNIFLVASLRGVWRSTDAGRSWSESNSGLDCATISGLATATDGAIWATARAGGTWKSTDFGKSWSFAGLAGGTNFCIAMNDEGRLLVGDQKMIFASSNNGISWDTLAYNNQPSPYNEIVFSPYGDIFTCGYDSIGRFSLRRSTDNGTSWTSSSTLGGLGVQSLAAHPNGSIYVGVKTRGLQRSTDWGATWTRIDSGDNLTDFYAIDLNSRNDIFAVTRSSRRIGNLLSTDGGETWEYLKHPISPYSALFAPDDVLYIGGATLWRSFDNGSTIEEVEALEDEFLPIEEMAIDSAGYLYAGTHGNGVYRSRYPVLTVDVGVDENGQEQIRDFSLSPNPAAVQAVARFTLKEPQVLSLTLCDILGNEVLRPVTRRAFAAGRHSIAIDTEHLPPGLYWCRLESPLTALTQPLVVMP